MQEILKHKNVSYEIIANYSEDEFDAEGQVKMLAQPKRFMNYKISSAEVNRRKIPIEIILQYCLKCCGLF